MTIFHIKLLKDYKCQVLLYAHFTKYFKLFVMVLLEEVIYRLKAYNVLKINNYITIVSFYLSINK